VSIALITQVFSQDIKPSTLKFVMVALADNANANGEAWPCVATISNKTSLSRRAVFDALNAAKHRGLIVDTGRRAGPKNQVIVYRITGATDARVQDLHECTTAHVTGAPHAHRTVREPSVQINKRPSLEAVKAYGAEIKLAPDQAEAFFDHFTSNGWKVSGRAPMKDWKAALRNWKRNTRSQSNGFNRSRPNGKLPAPIYPKLPPSREVTDAELAAQRKIVREASEEFHRAQNR
jgi:hypothetical protein